MKELIEALIEISHDGNENIHDREDYQYLAESVRIEDYETACTTFANMDTYARDLLTPYARKSEAVKTQAATMLEINWLF